MFLFVRGIFRGGRHMPQGSTHWLVFISMCALMNYINLFWFLDVKRMYQTFHLQSTNNIISFFWRIGQECSLSFFKYNLLSIYLTIDWYFYFNFRYLIDYDQYANGFQEYFIQNFKMIKKAKFIKQIENEKFLRDQKGI